MLNEAFVLKTLFTITWFADTPSVHFEQDLILKDAELVTDIVF